MPAPTQLESMTQSIGYDLSALPYEVSDYALDQLENRLRDEERVAEATRSLIENTACEHGSKKVILQTEIVGELLAEACREKIQDIETEVKRGERGDFSIQHCRRMRSHVDDIF